MIILRGKHAGANATLHQFCNDWVAGDLPDGRPVSSSVLAVELTPAEVATVRAKENVGTMWREFDLSDDGRFTRKPAVA